MTEGIPIDAQLEKTDSKARSRKFVLVAFTALVAATALAGRRIDGAQWVEINTLLIIVYVVGNVGTKGILAWFQTKQVQAKNQ